MIKIVYFLRERERERETEREREREYPALPYVCFTGFFMQSPYMC